MIYSCYLHFLPGELDSVEYYYISMMPGFIFLSLTWGRNIFAKKTSQNAAQHLMNSNWKSYQMSGISPCCIKKEQETSTAKGLDLEGEC